MDLSDILNGAIDRLDAKPPAAPAQRLLDVMLARLKSRAEESAKPPVQTAADKQLYLRASQVHEVLQNLNIWKAEIRPFPDLLKRPTPPPLGSQLTFDMGHALHDWYRENYLQDVLYGEWICTECGDTYTGLLQDFPKTEECHDGRPHHPEFYESFVALPKLRLGGHPDGLVAFTAGPPADVLEIKTASTSTWEKLTGPTEDHLTQTHVYMEATGLKSVLFVYIDKGRQTDWAWRDGELRPVGDPHIKTFQAHFEPKRWADISKGVNDFWTLYEAKTKAP